ncbi:MAG: calcium/sodium antiporter [Rhodothermales bacterium]|nr:calcium/sodium antiporter [Rhodothermales bacterium]
MLLQFFLFALGLGVLYLGADWLVRGASALALDLGIRPLMVGLTVVALGTSMPELLLNVFAVVQGVDALAIGNIIGSNIANIGLILGVTALVLPLTVAPEALKKEYPMMLGVTLLFWFLSWQGAGLSRIDGAILVTCLVAFMVYILKTARTRPPGSVEIPVADDFDAPEASPLARFASTKLGRVTYVIIGMGMLALGAELMVSSAVDIGDRLGIHPGVIGLTAVAIGTSLPELAASLVCALRGEADMSVGNVLGSNMLNIIFVVGLVAMIQPMAVEQEALDIHFPVMVGFTLLLFPLAWTRFRINRPEGAVLLTAFLSYFAYLLYPYL